MALYGKDQSCKVSFFEYGKNCSSTFTYLIKPQNAKYWSEHGV